MSDTFTALVLRDDHRGQIRWVLVHQSARGMGLGKELVRRALDWSREQGCTGIFLETTDGLPESQALYEALGFDVVLDEQDICQGCFRSAEEVTDWFMSSAERKREILALAEERREASSPFRLL